MGFRRPDPSISCSICSDVVKDGGDRSIAKLRCGHKFHLDCVGSTFNTKGVMQCPHCQKVEEGSWLYVNGPSSKSEPSLDEWAHDEDLYDITYSEMPLAIPWCPFSRLARVPSLSDSGSRLSGAFVSSSFPPYVTDPQGVIHARDYYRHHHHPPSIHGAVYPSVRHSAPMRGLPLVCPTLLPPPDQTYYLLPPTPSSSQHSRDAESTRGEHFYSHSWERDRLAPQPLLPVDRDSSGRRRPFPLSNGSSDSSSQRGFSHSNGPRGRTYVSSHRPTHVSRRRP